MTGVAKSGASCQAQPPPPEILVQYGSTPEKSLISQREAVIGRFSEAGNFHVAPCKLFLAEKLGQEQQ